MSLWAPYLAHNEYQIIKSRDAQCISEDDKECDIMNKIWIELDLRKEEKIKKKEETERKKATEN